jgi:hypothetical protein
MGRTRVNVYAGLVGTFLSSEETHVDTYIPRILS